MFHTLEWLICNLSHTLEINRYPTEPKMFRVTGTLSAASSPATTAASFSAALRLSIAPTLAIVSPRHLRWFSTFSRSFLGGRISSLRPRIPSPCPIRLSGFPALKMKGIENMNCFLSPYLLYLKDFIVSFFLRTSYRIHLGLPLLFELVYLYFWLLSFYLACFLIISVYIYLLLFQLRLAVGVVRQVAQVAQVAQVERFWCSICLSRMMILSSLRSSKRESWKVWFFSPFLPIWFRWD